MSGATRTVVEVGFVAVWNDARWLGPGRTVAFKLRSRACGRRFAFGALAEASFLLPLTFDCCQAF